MMINKTCKRNTIYNNAIQMTTGICCCHIDLKHRHVIMTEFHQHFLVTEKKSYCICVNLNKESHNESFLILVSEFRNIISRKTRLMFRLARRLQNGFFCFIVDISVMFVRTNLTFLGILLYDFFTT